MSEDIVAHLAKTLSGRSCSVTRRENDWAFDFGGECNIAASTTWRIVVARGIAFADADDGQMFGLPEPVDGQARANSLVEGSTVEAVEVDVLTADLRLRFTNGARIEFFNNSSGYEGWQARFPLDGTPTSIIGMGGGDLAIIRR